MLMACWVTWLPIKRMPLGPFSIWNRLLPPTLAWSRTPLNVGIAEQVSRVHVPLSCDCAIAVLGKSHTTFGATSWSRAIARSPPSKDTRLQSGWRMNLDAKPPL